MTTARGVMAVAATAIATATIAIAAGQDRGPDEPPVRPSDCIAAAEYADAQAAYHRDLEAAAERWPALADDLLTRPPLPRCGARHLQPLEPR